MGWKRAIVQISETGQEDLIRRAEGWKDICNTRNQKSFDQLIPIIPRLCHLYVLAEGVAVEARR